MDRNVVLIGAFCKKEKKLKGNEIVTRRHTGINTPCFLFVCHARTEKFNTAFLLPGLINTITMNKSFSLKGIFHRKLPSLLILYDICMFGIFPRIVVDFYIG